MHGSFVVVIVVVLTGMKYDCASKEITAKDIVSSIICAANRKMQKAKSKKATTSTSSMSQQTSEDVVDNQDIKQVCFYSFFF